MLVASGAASLIVALEIFLRLPLAQMLDSANDTARRVWKTMNSRAISEHWKEVVVPLYAAMLLKQLSLLLGCFLVALTPVALFVVAFGAAGIDLLLTPLNLLGAVVVAGVYTILRARVRAWLITA